MDTFKQAQTQLVSYLYPFLSRVLTMMIHSIFQSHGFIYDAIQHKIGILFESQPQTLQQCQDQKDQQLPYCIDISILFYSIKQIISYIKNCLMALNYIHSKGPNYCHGIESLPISIFQVIFALQIFSLMATKLILLITSTILSPSPLSSSPFFIYLQSLIKHVFIGIR